MQLIYKSVPSNVDASKIHTVPVIGMLELKFEVKKSQTINNELITSCPLPSALCPLPLMKQQKQRSEIIATLHIDTSLKQTYNTQSHS